MLLHVERVILWSVSVQQIISLFSVIQKLSAIVLFVKEGLLNVYS